VSATGCYCQTGKCGTAYCTYGKYSSAKPLFSPNSCCGIVVPTITLTPTPTNAAPKCKEECPGTSNASGPVLSDLKNCHPPDTDGTPKETLCNATAAGTVSQCGGKNFCCPNAGGTWTTDLSKCPNVTTTPGSCKECPSTFKCYVNGTEYKWFVDGYVMGGFTASTSATCGGVAKPSFLGKSKGDANCDGVIDTSDYSLWHKEFFDGNEGATVKPDYWDADFTGPNGACDGKVDTSDYSLWHKYFYDLNGLSIN
jgi:hypothetical protein